MTEPPRPPGDAGPGDRDPTAPPPPPPASSTPPGEAPGSAYAPPPSPPSGEGYPPPPGGAYPPPGGFGQPAAPGYASADDKTFALIAHFGGAAGAFISGGILGFVAPLIAYLAKGQQSASVRAHAVAALNFQLLWSLIALASYTVSWCLLFVPTLAIVIFQVIVGILGGVKANEGQGYRYPLSYNFIK